MKKRILLYSLVLFLGSTGLAFADAQASLAVPALPAERIESIPVRYRIEHVPLYVQARNECGPTALSMVMNFYGVDEPIAALKPALHWHSENGVSYQSMIGLSYKDFGLEIGFAGEGDARRLFEAVSRNRPVLVRQWANREEKTIGTTGHWRAVVGYDQERQIVYLHDPMFSRTTTLNLKEFLSLWDMRSHANPTRNYMLLLRPAPEESTGQGKQALRRLLPAVSAGIASSRALGSGNVPFRVHISGNP